MTAETIERARQQWLRRWEEAMREQALAVRAGAAA
jgi:ribosome modulation factor